MFWDAYLGFLAVRTHRLREDDDWATFRQNVIQLCFYAVLLVAVCRCVGLLIASVGPVGNDLAVRALLPSTNAFVFGNRRCFERILVFGVLIRGLQLGEGRFVGCSSRRNGSRCR
jgi:hypothetical protein